MTSLARLAAGAVAIVAVALAWRFATIGERDYTSGEPEAPADIQSAIAGLFVEGRCTTTAEAEERLPATLSELGHPDWIVDTEADVAVNDCVTPATLTLERRVLLMKALPPEVNAVLDVLTNHTLDHCLRRNEAIELVASRLHSLGETDYKIETGGMLAAPAERWEEAKRHYEAGCYVFSGTGRDSEGARVYYVTGK